MVDIMGSTIKMAWQSPSPLLHYEIDFASLAEILKEKERGISMRTTIDTKDANIAIPGANLRFLWLEITSKCNLECEHCYADSGPHRSTQGVMEADDWFDIIREAKSLGCNSCQFIGGEPTLHPNFRDFVVYARSLDIAVEVYTNATRLTPDLVQFFSQYQIRLATSFYSDVEEAHDLVTRRKGSWARTVTGIERVVASGLPLRVGVIETNHNVGHYDRTKHYLKALGVTSIDFDRERGIGRGKTAAVVDPMGELCGQCSKGRLCVTADAKVYPCVFSRFVDLGDARSGLATVLVSPSLSRFRVDLDSRVAMSSGADAHCPPDEIPCKPDQCEPAGCSPAYCRPKDCPPTDDCRPNNPCTPDECNPNTA